MIVTGVGGDDLALALGRADLHVRKLKRVSDEEVEVIPAPAGTRYLLLRRDGLPMPRLATWVCKHGHDRLFREIFRIEPNAHVETVMTVYRGLDDFLLRQDEVSERWDEQYGRDFRCDCPALDRG